MGQKILDLLSLLEIPTGFLRGDWQKDRAEIRNLHQQMLALSSPVALIVSRGSLEAVVPSQPRSSYHLSRLEAIKTITNSLSGQEAVVATTGKISRELYNSLDQSGNFYMVGSMGCASAIGLGLALAQPHRTVVVLDGDGACLMKLGNLATIGHHRPRNLIHVVLDNEAYDSTGGQATTSSTISLAAVAREAGYASSHQVTEAQDLTQHLGLALTQRGPHCIVVKVATGAAADLQRPHLAPPDLKDRFRSFTRQTRRN